MYKHLFFPWWSLFIFVNTWPSYHAILCEMSQQLLDCHQGQSCQSIQKLRNVFLFSWWKNSTENTNTVSDFWWVGQPTARLQSHPLPSPSSWSVHAQTAALTQTYPLHSVSWSMLRGMDVAMTTMQTCQLFQSPLVSHATHVSPINRPYFPFKNFFYSYTQGCNGD